MTKIILKNGLIINRGQKMTMDIMIKDDRIERIDTLIDEAGKEIDLEGKIVIPGIIDDQVHFREPGYTHKANIASESRAALLGGVTSFMEMPNTKPPAINVELLEKKYAIAAKSSPSNYSFFIGATNDNLDAVLEADRTQICGIKAFMGSSTGDLLVDDRDALDTLFRNAHMLIATHCEDEETIKRNQRIFEERFGDDLNAIHHPQIRNAEGCYLSSSYAVELAKKHQTRLHILHISTAIELELFTNQIPLTEKHITSEVCVHHLFFNDQDYASLGNLIKCNPAIKTKEDQESLFNALLDDRLDIIATDHAPHTKEEKEKPYNQSPSGLPLVQHSLLIMYDFYKRGMISLEDIVRKMCHAPAQCFNVADRGYLDEGSFADIVIMDPRRKYVIEKDNIAFKCGWSPLEGRTFDVAVDQVWVNGVNKVKGGKLIDKSPGKRLLFNR